MLESLPQRQIYKTRPCLAHSTLCSHRLYAYRTRLDVQAETVVAIDVEYMHVRLMEDGGIYEKVQIPCEVCLVDALREPLVYTKIDSLTELLERHPMCKQAEYTLEYEGGCTFKEIDGKPRLSEVKEELLSHIRHRLVIGHNLAKDLLSLDISEKDIPISKRRDTMSYPKLQNEKGHGRALAELSLNKLGREIQQSRHDSMEDALATLDLYLQFCHYDESLMEYDDLVEYHTYQMLQNIKAPQAPH